MISRFTPPGTPVCRYRESPGGTFPPGLRVPTLNEKITVAEILFMPEYIGYCDSSGWFAAFTEYPDYICSLSLLRRFDLPQSLLEKLQPSPGDIDREERRRQHETADEELTDLLAQSPLRAEDAPCGPSFLPILPGAFASGSFPEFNALRRAMS